MMLQETVYNNALFDTYGALLTKKQQDVYICTYQLDLSLAEVAENNGISRAAVHDTLKKAQKLLDHYEATLSCVKREAMRDECLKELLLLGHPAVDVVVKRLKQIENE